MGPTAKAAEWVAKLDYDDIPKHALDKAKLQILSVLSATVHGAKSSKAKALHRAIARGETQSGGPCTVIGTAEGSSLWEAIYLNAASSVVHDFDDYLFAGHTGHSAVLVSLAVSQLLRHEGKPVDGRTFLSAVVSANETGGRLGASMLLGPHNGQMWSYIHLIGGATAASKLLGLDPTTTESAIGLAFSQPNYPLVATFMGSDAKQLIASQPAVDGAKGAFMAAEGLRGAPGILEDRGGFWARFHKDALAKMFSGFGTAWVTDSLSYKIYPGCAYLDTAEDALFDVLSQFEESHGRRLEPRDVKSIRIEGGMLTTGMETMSGWYRSEHISPMNVNFSAALSTAITILAGRLTPAELEPDFYLSKEAEILKLAERVAVVSSPEMTLAMAPQKGSEAAFDLRDVLKKPEDALEGVDFSRYEARFPAALTLITESGEEFYARQDIPLGAAGRPEEETRQLVRQKAIDALGSHAGERLIERVEKLDDAEDAASIVDLFTESS
jgi:2-methylcitrate dehydratase PrpD